MNITFAAISPHPSAILPTVGSDSDIKRAAKTIRAIEELARGLAASKPDVLVVISPYIPVNFTSFSIVDSLELKGRFDKFGDFKTEMRFEGHPEMVLAIKKRCGDARIPLGSFNNPELDHGTSIPLHFISQELPKIKVVPVGVSGLSPMEHVSFGKVIIGAANALGIKMAVIASGELSHGLSPSSSAGYSPKGKEFDFRILELLKRGDQNTILEIEQDLLEESGECGYLPMAVLFGVLDGTTWKGEVLSYESPFGIGYPVVKIKMSKKR